MKARIRPSGFGFAFARVYTPSVLADMSPSEGYPEGIIISLCTVFIESLHPVRRVLSFIDRRLHGYMPSVRGIYQKPIPYSNSHSFHEIPRFEPCRVSGQTFFFPKGNDCGNELRNQRRSRSSRSLVGDDGAPASSGNRRCVPCQWKLSKKR